MDSVFNCCSLHSVSIFRFVGDVQGVCSCVLLSYCVSARSAVFPWFQVHSAVLSQSLAGIKESSHWKESRACCLTTFCVLSSKLFFMRQEAICLQTKNTAPRLPPTYLVKLKYLSGLFLVCPCRLSRRAQLYGMVCIGLFKECQPQWQISSPVLSLCSFQPVKWCPQTRETQRKSWDTNSPQQPFALLLCL